MEHIRLEPQPENVAPVDEAIKALVEEALESANRGELVTLEQARINMRKRLESWRKDKEAVLLQA